MSRADQVFDDGRAHKAARAGDENMHAKSSRLTGADLCVLAIGVK
jgi:hypothetical protein